MSLRQAIESITQGMEEDLNAVFADDPLVKGLVRSYIRMLRTACQAASHEVDDEENENLRAIREQMEKDSARVEKLARKASQRLEGNTLRMVKFADGPLAGDMVPVPSDMPIGAKTAEFGGVYELRSDGMFWDVLLE